jgi:DNA polymerase III epsilon subunit-like protein
MAEPNERLIFVDLETAGLETWRPIIQLAAIAVTSASQELETFEAKVLFDERDATPESLRKNQYCRERWQQEGRPAKVVAEAFAAFLRRHATLDLFSREGRPYRVAQLVAHNAVFDGPFLRDWYDRLGVFLPAGYRVYCTLQRAFWLFHEDKTLTPPADFKLGTLCRYFGVRLPDHEAHDALADVRATVQLYRAITAWTARHRAVA